MFGSTTARKRSGGVRQNRRTACGYPRVYTPPESRRRGYASNAVAGVSRIALDAGAEYCMLVAEREPAQPARIYRALGFNPIRDHLVIDLLR